jgi:hypothetical protein
VDCTYLSESAGLSGQAGGGDEATRRAPALEGKGQLAIYRPQFGVAIADCPGGRPAADIGVAQNGDQGLGHGVGPSLAHWPALTKAKHAVMRGHHLPHLWVLELGYSLHPREQ